MNHFDTAPKRELTIEPKFVQKRRTETPCKDDFSDVSTFENDNGEKL